MTEGGGTTRIDQRLTYLKDQVDLTWDQVAERAGVSSSGLRKIRQGEVVPRRITREGLAYALRVDRSEIDEILGVDDNTPEPEGVTWADMALAAPGAVLAPADVVSKGELIAGYANLFIHRQMAAGKPRGVLSALLVYLPPQILADLHEAEIESIQTKLSEYAVFVATQTLRERT
jgi:transcriptional regulator with XRE-family HTH domain